MHWAVVKTDVLGVPRHVKKLEKNSLAQTQNSATLPSPTAFAFKYPR